MSSAMSMKDQSFEIGKILGGAFGLIGRKPLIVFGLALVFAAIPTRLFYYAVGAWAPSGGASGAASFGWLLLTNAWSFVVQTIVPGALIGTAVIVYEGGRPDLDIGLRPALQRLAPLIGVSLLYAIGCLIGVATFFIPFLFLLVRWSIVAPVAVMEPVGVGEAFGRSSELTRGIRLKIFGLIIVTGLLESLAAAVVNLLSLVLGSALLFGQDASLDPVAVTLRIVMETAISGFSAAVYCMLYIALRERMEGPMSDRLTEIFR